jgi:hypothetical protein
MEKFCPLCNGIAFISVTCAYCGHEMTNQGTVIDYYGPYSPYEYLYCQEDNICTHLFYCPNCHNDKRIAVPLETLHCYHIAE